MKKLLIPGLLSLLILTSCEKQVDEFESPAIEDYFPVAIGKSITYKLDSSVYINFGTQKDTRSYIVKDSIEGQATDLIGRPTFRVARYFQDQSNPSMWTNRFTYFITPEIQSIEVIENNLRFIKLIQPIKNEVTWNGNRHLPEEPFNQFDFTSSDHSQLGNWEYQLEGVGDALTIGNLTFDNTITVTGTANDSTNFPLVDPNGPGYRTVWNESYAAGVGLIYRRISFEEYQPPNPSNGFFTGFEVTLKVLSHN